YGTKPIFGLSSRVLTPSFGLLGHQACMHVMHSGTSDYTNLALTHIIPSGWEIYNERMLVADTESPDNMASTSRNSISKYSYQDIRDDRVLTYFNLRRGETKVFTVRLQATYAGNFILPAVQCEAMYDATVQARSKAGRTTVSR
ncbi:hypothetical protein, partial [Bacteroides acidifaciens]|uniref:alpha-2-macroglobulin family protein n=1 Tax=Bacteroides acidifaciens TaxID=85831 RepID=UPI0026769090